VAVDFLAPRAVGARVLRREDRRFLTGRGRYVTDVRLPGLLQAAFVRSPHGHARITSVDTAGARVVAGVVAVLTARDLSGVARPMRARCSNPGYQECSTPVIADDRVRYMGEVVAMVVARSRYAAEDGVDAVRVDYEPLPVLGTIDEALAVGADRIHDEVEGNLFNAFEVETGDVAGAFAAASEVVELEVAQQRCAAAALEGRAVTAVFDPGGGSLTVWLSSQVPHLARTGFAEHLGLPETRVRVIAPDIGGGFGPKCVMYQEDLAVAAAAKVLGRPVQWIADRSEDLQTTVHGRQHRVRIRAAADAEGHVTAVMADVYAANGAYAPWPFTAALDSGQASDNVTGPYAIASYGRRVRAVVTNQTPMGPYRGVGRVVACFAIERVMDELARRLRVDQLEIRRRNLVRSFPYTTAAGLRFESGDYLAMVDRLEEAIGWREARAANEALHARGVHRGLGVAIVVEQSAYGPQSLGSRGMEITPGYDTALLRLEPDGRLRVAVGLHNHGQGHETTIAQIAADELGLSVDDVEVVFGDTDVVPYGLGTWASRSTVACGGATILAGRELRRKVLDLAGDMLEADAEDLMLANGAVHVKGARSRRVSVRDVARRSYFEPHLLPAGTEPGLEVTRRFMPPDPGTFSSSAHAAHVEVDVDTGHVDLLRYVVVEDCGTVVNPMIVEGQVHGGVAQGIGGALYENLVYDAEGSLLTTSFMDYLLPTANEVPSIEIEHLESPSPHVPGGFKGMGEGGAINSPAAIVCAVNDALAPFEVTANRTPLTPSWIVEAIRAAGSRA